MTSPSAEAVERARKIAFCDDAQLRPGKKKHPIIEAREGTCDPPCRLHAAIARLIEESFDRGMREGQKQLQQYEECGQGFYTNDGNFLACDLPTGHHGAHSGVV